MPDYDNMSLSEIFKLDTSERIKTLNELLIKLEKGPGNGSTAYYDDAMREAHSLKGAARIVNNTEIQNLAHMMEEILEVTRKNNGLNSDYVDLFLENLDAILEMSDAFVKGRAHSIDVEDLLTRLGEAKEGRFRKKKGIAPHASTSQADCGESDRKVTEKANNSSDKRRESKKLSTKGTGAVSTETLNVRSPERGDSTRKKLTVEKAMTERNMGDMSIRVGIEKLNRLMNLSGEIYTSTLHLERERDHSKKLPDYLVRLASNHDSLIAFLKEEGIVSEHLEEWAFRNQTDLTDFQETLTSYLDKIDHLSVSFGYLGSQMQDEVMRSRMLPASTIFEPHLRFVRDSSRESGKKIRLNLKGKDTPIDRGILEVLKDPLMHIVRNSCDHGIEYPQERKKAGKNEEGQLTLYAYQKADRIILVIEDDGKGLDTQMIKEKLLEKKLISEEKAGYLTSEEILDFIFLPGFSTATKVTTLSGRGVGLDVVKSYLSRIDGQVSVESQKGKFTRFILSLPLTLSIIKSLLVEVGGEIFCIHLTRVKEVYVASESEIKSVEGIETVSIQGNISPIVRLSTLWEMDKKTSLGSERLLVVIGEGQDSISFQVDRYIGVKEIVSKPLDRRLTNIHDISSVTVLDNGQVAFIIDLESLSRSCAESTGKKSITLDQKDKITTRKRILVCEDSITIRELERKVLQNNGYEVEVASDGMEGFNKIKESKYDLLVTDIEMPRMDGFELIRLIKKDEQLRNIPTIIVSFKEREEDKRRGMEVGADRYLTKNKYDDEILLEAIERLIK